jgi:hypothetical protein
MYTTACRNNNGDNGQFDNTFSSLSVSLFQSNINIENMLHNRRLFLLDATINIGRLALPMVSMVYSCSASAQSIPHGPDERSVIVAPYATSVEALIPAIRVRQMIDQSIDITKQLVKINNTEEQSLSSINPKTMMIASNQQEKDELLQHLQQLLLQKQNFTSLYDTNNSMMKSTPPSQQISSSYKQRYNENRAKLDALAQPGALLAQRGEIATWKRLQQKEYELEQNDEIRMALNIYMNNIVYTSKQYTLTVPNDVRKQMIRNEQLPDILQQVVPSDIDLRTLYRNMILTNMQDARAELQYQCRNRLATIENDNIQNQKQQHLSSFDVQELLYLLQQARDALQQWFNMIELNEITNAELAMTT